jgi:hypothetical protein
MNQIVGLIAEAYNRRAGLLILSFVLAAFGLVTLSQYQSITVPSLTNLFDVMKNDGKHLALTFIFNLFSCLFLLMTSFLWFVSAFKANEDSQGYRYHDDASTIITNVLTYAVTGIATASFGLVFALYIFNKIFVVLIVAVVGALGLYSNANKK